MRPVRTQRHPIRTLAPPPDCLREVAPTSPAPPNPSGRVSSFRNVAPAVATEPRGSIISIHTLEGGPPPSGSNKNPTSRLLQFDGMSLGAGSRYLSYLRRNSTGLRLVFLSQDGRVSEPVERYP